MIKEIKFILENAGSISNISNGVDCVPFSQSNWFSHFAITEGKNGYRLSIVQMFGNKYYSLEELKSQLDDNGYSSSISTYVNRIPRRVLRIKSDTPKK